MTKSQWDTLWYNARIAAFTQDAFVLPSAAIAVKDQRIAWVGAMSELNGQPESLAKQTYDVKGKLLTPGLVDCHTHLVYAGDRAQEFAARLEGESYESIARRGGGINATVTATRAASEDELFAQSLPRARALLASGVTTLEIKSGYGLTLEAECKILRVAKRIEETLPVTVYKTFLGAHTIPPEFKGKEDNFVDLICNDMIPEVAEQKLADAVDVFCEKIAFSTAQTERIFATAAQYGLPVKCHAEQLSHLGASALAAKYHALSADHLEFATESDIIAMAEAGTAAVLLPGAFYFLREERVPPIALLRKHKVPMAIASDCNPGTSPFLALPLLMHMACTLFRLTIEEAWLAVTENAAKCLTKKPLFGTLMVENDADFVIWDCEELVTLCYYAGLPYPHKVVKKGNIVKFE